MQAYEAVARSFGFYTYEEYARSASYDKLDFYKALSAWQQNQKPTNQIVPRAHPGYGTPDMYAPWNWPAPQVFISPSNQHYNVGADDFGTEKDRMNEIAIALHIELARQGITVYRAPAGTSSTDAVAMSNRNNVAIHVALHSNAASGNKAGQVRGTEIHTRANDATSMSLASDVLSSIMTIAPSVDDWNRGIKHSAFRELRGVDATSIYIEYAFHDNPDDARWIVDNIDEIARLTAQGIVNHLR